MRCAALSKSCERDSSSGVFSWILQDFLEHLFCMWLSYVIQKRCSKKFVEFQGWSFVLSGISRGKIKKWKIPGFFQKSMSSTPLFFFFWNSPIGLVWPTANLWIFIELTVSQYLRNWVFPVRCSFQLILHALMSTQTTCIKVDDVTKMITEVYLDIQATARGNIRT